MKHLVLEQYLFLVVMKFLLKETHQMVASAFLNKASHIKTLFSLAIIIFLMDIKHMIFTQKNWNTE